MSSGPFVLGTGRRRALLVLALTVAVPLLVLGTLLARPATDALWENHQAHFWLVLAAAAIAFALGNTVGAAARRRRDARLILVSLAFIISAGFLGLHSLATPGVLLGPNAGFELATPVGLALSGVLVAMSAYAMTPRVTPWVVRHAGALLAAVLGLMVVWGVVSLAALPPLDTPLPVEELNGWQTALAVVGVATYAAAAIGYLLLYRRRRAWFAFIVSLAFCLLAEAMIVLAAASNWRLSWWEWHVLMLGAFGLIALSARSEWSGERYTALYLDQTLAGAREASVLFADLKGFTSFSEAHPPQEVARMLNGYFGPLIPVLERAGGNVHQMIGDALMVVFNKEGQQPEHALLAARAGLLLQAEAGRLASSEAHWPRFRVGVNSGLVLAGVIGGQRGLREHGLVGDTVNTAARLEAAAPVGKVLIGAGTAERLPPGADLEPVPPLSVKGKTEPVTAYVLHALPDDRVRR